MQMRVVYLIFCYYHIVLCENKTISKRKSQEILIVHGYLHGHKFGQLGALKIPAFLFTPIVIVPKINQENSNLQRDGSAENEQEVSATFQEIIPLRIILNDTNSKEDHNDIEVNFRQALNRGSNNNTSEAISDNTLKQSENNAMLNILNVNNTGNTTKLNGTTLETTTTEVSDLQKNITEVLTSTEPSGLGLYPTAVYNDQTVNTLTITDEPPNYFLLPPLLDDEWKNFTVTTDINIVKENTTEPTINPNNVTAPPLTNETNNTIKGPYTAAMYNNAEIDQLSITTNSYTNESPLPPPQDDRWTSFSSMGGTLSASNEFRPLAGLYYDGFLHRPPAKNPGFVPYNQNFLY